MAASLLSLSEYYASLAAKLQLLQQQQRLTPPAVEALFLLHRGLGCEEEEAAPEEREEALLFYHPEHHPRARRLAMLRVAGGLVDFTQQFGSGGGGGTGGREGEGEDGVEVVHLQRKAYLFLRYRPPSSPACPAPSHHHGSQNDNDQQEQEKDEPPQLWLVAVMRTTTPTTSPTPTTTTTADPATIPPAAPSGVSPRIVLGLLKNAMDAFELFAPQCGLGASFFAPTGGNADCHARRVRAAVGEVRRLRRRVRKGGGEGGEEEGLLAAAVAASPVTGLRSRLAAFLRPLLLQGQELERPHLFDVDGGGMHYLPPFPDQPALLSSLHAAHTNFLARIGAALAPPQSPSPSPSPSSSSSSLLRPLDATFVYDGHIVWRGKGVSTRQLSLIYACLKARDHAALLAAMTAATAAGGQEDHGQPQSPPPTTTTTPVSLAAAIDTHSLHYRRPSVASSSSPINNSSNSSGGGGVGLMGRIQSFAAANNSGGSRTAPPPPDTTVVSPTKEPQPQPQQSTSSTPVIWLRGGFFDASRPLTLVPPVAPAAAADDGAAAATAQPQPQAMPMYPLPSPPDQSQQQQRLLAIYLVGPLAVLLVLAREGEGGQGQEAGPDAMRAIGVEVERRLLPALQQPACLGPTTLFDRFGAKGGSAGGGGGELMLGASAAADTATKGAALLYRDRLTGSVSTSLPSQILPELQYWPACSHAHLKHHQAAPRLAPAPVLPSLLDDLALALLMDGDEDGGFREMAIRTRQQGWLLARRANDRAAVAALGPKVTSILEAQDAFNALLATALKGRQLL